MAVLFLTVKRGRILGSVKALGKRCSAHTEVCGTRSGSVGPMTQADDALGRPGAEASPLPSQTLCLSLQDPVDFLEKAQKRQPPELPQVTGDTPTFKASEKEGEQLQKKIMDGLNANSHVPEGPEPLAQEVARRKQRRGGQGEGERRAEPWRTRMGRALKATASRLASRTGNLPKTSPWPDLLGAHLGHVPGEVERKEEAGDAQRWSKADPKGLAEDADFNVYLFLDRDRA